MRDLEARSAESADVRKGESGAVPRYLDGLEEIIFAPGPCALCGRNPAPGFASVNDQWYCHGEPKPYGGRLLRAIGRTKLRCLRLFVRTPRTFAVGLWLADAVVAL